MLGLLAAMVWAGPSPAAQAKAPKSQAAKAYEAGKGELRGGKMSAALETFRKGLSAPETDQLETWQLLLGAALASEKVDRGADAIEYYRRFLDASEGAEKLLPPKWRERRQVVSDAVDELQRKLYSTHGYLTVSSTPTSAAIYVNDRRAGVDANATTPFAIFLTPGSYQIRVERQDYEPSISQVDIEVGKLKPLNLKLAEVVPEPPPAPVTPLPVAARVTGSSEPSATPLVSAKVSMVAPADLSMPGWTLVGTGSALVVGGIVATVVGALAQQEASLYHAEELQGMAPNQAVWENYNDMLSELEIINAMQGVLYGLGTAAGIVGLILVVLDGVEPGAQEALTTFQLSPTHGGAFGQATLRF